MATPATKSSDEAWRELDLPFHESPRVLRDLPGGRSNKSTLIEADGQRWVVRINSSKSAFFGIDRHAEESILRIAAAAGIAPAVVYCSVSSGVLISEYIDGQQWRADALSNAQNLEKFFAVVRVTHGLQTATPVVDQYQHAENYWNSLLAAQFVATDELLSERDQILSERSKDTSSVNANVLCHRDLTPLNVIEGNCRLYLLDWEYAARGAAAFDFASIAAEWDVPSDTLVANFQLNRGELERAQALYRYTCHLWEALDQLPM